MSKRNAVKFHQAVITGRVLAEETLLLRAYAEQDGIYVEARGHRNDVVTNSINLGDLIDFVEQATESHLVKWTLREKEVARLTALLQKAAGHQDGAFKVMAEAVVADKWVK